MHTTYSIHQLKRAIRNMLRVGIIVDINLSAGRCRVQTGAIITYWIAWLTPRAGGARVWWAPSINEQVLILALGGELDTAFVLPAIYSVDSPPPTHSAQAWQVNFPDGAWVCYEPQSGKLSVQGINTADISATQRITATAPLVQINAAERISLNTPEVYCSDKLTTGVLEVRQRAQMRGEVEHQGGSLSSNGKVLHTHRGDSGGKTGEPL